MSEQSPTPDGGPVQHQPYAQQPYAEPSSQPYAQPYEQPYSQPYEQPYSQPYEQPYAQAYEQPYGQYPQAYTGYGYAPAARPTNPLAIVSLVAAIVGVTFVPLIGSIVAVITGPMARKQIRDTGENGDGMALAGIIVGWVAIGGILLIGLLFIVPFVFFSAASVSSY